LIIKDAKHSGYQSKMGLEMNDTGLILRFLEFAASRHRTQFRKGYCRLSVNKKMEELFDETLITARARYEG
jgi:hypothetical protein